jgi:outer membrane protein OmpA-like peptidoglycan-associated protein
MAGQIVAQRTSYRQGLVLGLTMAEVMLLLVFCLLIALASFLHVEQSKNTELNRQLGQEKADNESNRELVALIGKNPDLMDRLRKSSEQYNHGSIDELWRELVDSRAVTAELEKKGVSIKEVRDRVSEAIAFRAGGVDLQSSLRNAEIVDAINRELASKAMPPITKQTVSGLLSKSETPKADTGGHRWPPIISLSEANGNYFKTGSAELSPQFRETLTTKIPERIASYVKQFDVDVIEVVGHTDGQTFGVRHQPTDGQSPPLEIARQSNLDRELQTVLGGRTAVARLTPADNAGLGLARAVSVVTVLKQSPLLKDYKLIPLSGAQLVNTDETLALTLSGDLPHRRRIEIRLRKSTATEAEVSSTSSITAPVQPKPTSPRRAPATPTVPPQKGLFQPALR